MNNDILKVGVREMKRKQYQYYDSRMVTKKGESLILEFKKGLVGYGYVDFTLSIEYGKETEFVLDIKDQAVFREKNIYELYSLFEEWHKNK